MKIFMQIYEICNEYMIYVNNAKNETYAKKIRLKIPYTDQSLKFRYLFSLVDFVYFRFHGYNLKY